MCLGWVEIVNVVFDWFILGFGGMFYEFFIFGFR